MSELDDLRAEVERLRADLGRRDDFLVQIRRLGAEYEVYLAELSRPIDEVDRLRESAIGLQNRVLELAREAHDLRAENERLRLENDRWREWSGVAELARPSDEGEQSDA